MKLLIADDEPLARERLKALVNEIDDSIVICEAANGLEVLSQIAAFEPDIVLLDIRMPEMDGIEVAQHLSELPNPPAVIYTTAYNEHAIEAFQANAIAYLLKPVPIKLLEQALMNAPKINKLQLHTIQQTLTEQKSERSQISTQLSGNIQLIPVEKILYFQADSKYVLIKYLYQSPEQSLQVKEALIDESLKNLANEFINQFIRIHRNTIVNKDYIESLLKASPGHLKIKLHYTHTLLEVSRRHQAEIRKLVKNS